MFITSYYLRAHMYTLVPRHVREDMQWMADHGTDAVAIGMLEQDLFAAVENVAWICDETDRFGMKVFAIPSRWGGLVAGAPKVPSIFCARHHEALACGDDGKPIIDWLGGKASVHHPATFEFFGTSLQRMFDRFPIAGVIWDEVKNLDERDYSEAARTALAGKDLDDPQPHAQATAGFFDRIGAEVLRMRPEVRLSMFLIAVEVIRRHRRQADFDPHYPPLSPGRSRAVCHPGGNPTGPTGKGRASPASAQQPHHAAGPALARAVWGLCVEEPADEGSEAGDSAREPAPSASPPDAAVDRRVLYVERQMRNFPATPYDPEILARSIHVSPSQMNRLFNRYRRQSPLRRYQEIRVELAREYLVYSTLSIKEIAERCGFAGADHFARVFRQCNGLSPREYRTRHQPAAR